jgi:ABC-type glycerol-3-phosphate transport system substrate-binding protein
VVIDEPEIRQKLIKVIDSYTAFYRKGCTPPDAVNWSTGHRNNKAFLAQTVVMTENETLSITNALKSDRPDDYYKNSATIEWPLGPTGEPFPIEGSVSPAVVFKDGDHVATAEEFVRFLVGEGWLMHYLNFSGERMLPPMQKLIDQPFWLDPSDPHRMAAVMQVASRPMQYDHTQALGDPRHDRVWQEWTWAKGDPPRRRRGHQLRAGGRRGDRPDQRDPERVTVPAGLSVQAAVTLMRAAGRERGFFRMTISTSRSSAVRNVISRSTEKPSSL